MVTSFELQGQKILKRLISYMARVVQGVLSSVKMFMLITLAP